MRHRTPIAVLCALVLVAVAVGYTLHVRAGQATPGAPDATRAESLRAAGPRLQVLSNGALSMVDALRPDGPRTVTSQLCDRAYRAADTIACLRPVDALATTSLVVLDPDLREQRSVPLAGFPNRVRVSASGRMVGWTLFVSGHSYATLGFATRAGILDTRTGALADNLEEFAVTVDGRPHRAADINVWGVTFGADDNRFHATMATGGHRYLVEGDFAGRTLRTVADNVECPSLSADGTRIAFKSAVDGDPRKGWRLAVLRLADGAVTTLAETRSVDDQPAWLDGATVGYAVQRPDGGNDVWAVAADGSGQPRLVVSGANSPAAVTG
ncbi:TolB family protein [Longispora urticae]